MSEFVFHLVIDEFFISIERSLDLEIKDYPVVVAPTFSDRSLIWEASRSAKELGIKEMMPLSVAKKRCRELKVIHPKVDLYQKIQRGLEQKFLSKWTPCFEIASPGKFHLDMSGTQKLFGSFQQSAEALLKELRHNLSFFAFLGAGRNKLVSQIASSNLQNCMSLESVKQKPLSMVVQEGGEERFLNPLPVYLLPVINQMILNKGIKSSDETNFLRDLNIHSIQDLRQLSAVGLKVLFGKEWRSAHLQSRGIDFDPVKRVDYSNRISSEYFLEKPSNSLNFLCHRLQILVEDCFLKWQKVNFELGIGQIFYRYEDFKTAEELIFLNDSYTSLDDLLNLFREKFTQSLRRRTALVTLKVEFIIEKTLGKQLSFLTDLEQQKSMHVLNLVEKVKGEFGGKGLFCGREDEALNKVG
ncbi:hypothetical protein N9N67_03545 [Bacteriovoracaceae bacterium]|nr:hypothetical protein [Bacteriovoracaceae bacterium]